MITRLIKWLSKFVFKDLSPGKPCDPNEPCRDVEPQTTVGVKKTIKF